MKLLTEYIEYALGFERLAAEEDNPSSKLNLKTRRGPIASSLPIAQPDTGCRRQVRAGPRPRGKRAWSP
jgi:hypothetical protein